MHVYSGVLFHALRALAPFISQNLKTELKNIQNFVCVGIRIILVLESFRGTTY
jgi:hypothetical protein